MRSGLVLKIVVGGYLTLVALAVVANITTTGDFDGLNYLALEVVALPWTIILIVAKTPDSIYPWLLTLGGLINAALLYVIGRAIGRTLQRSRERKGQLGSSQV